MGSCLTISTRNYPAYLVGKLVWVFLVLLKGVRMLLACKPLSLQLR